MATFKELWKRLSVGLTELSDKFYYQKYFEWNLPARNFIQVNIETTTVCTRKCHFCLYGVNDEVPATRMSAGLYFRIIDQLAEMDYSGRLSLFNINEPLTDKRIFDFLAYASIKLPKAYHCLVSNGDLLTADNLKRLFYSGLDHLMINSYDSDALEKNTALIETAGDLSKRIMHTDRTNYTEWHSRGGNVPAYYEGARSGFCELPNYVLYIKPDGSVLSCCNDFNSENILANVNDVDLRQAWFEGRYKSFRKAINSGDRTCSALCSRCDYKVNLSYFKFNDEVARGRHRIPREEVITHEGSTEDLLNGIRVRHSRRENGADSKDGVTVSR